MACARLATPGGRCPKHNGRVGKPLSPRTVGYCHAVLRSALSDAVRDELVARNAAQLVQPPDPQRQQVKPLTVDEATAVLVTAATDPLRAVWLLLLGTGLRRGEALALRWHNLDLERGDMTVEKSLQRERGDVDPHTGRRHGRLVETKPKTPGSAATLALPTFLVDVLREHRQAQVAQRVAAPVWVDPGLVFTTHVGTALEPRNVSRSWEALCKRAGVRRVALHDLRHSAASFALAAGVDIKVIQTMLRHSRLATTADLYTHVLEGVQRAGADRMDTVLRGLSGSAIAT